MEADDEFFKAYNDVSIHALMLKDVPRTMAYKEAIELSAEYFKHKTVLDLGSGTGILSMFAAKFADKVFAIEASEMAKISQEIIGDNGLSEKITVINQKIEDVQKEEIGNVDILISEWMGFYLLHESMLNSVIECRDTFKPKHMLPSNAKLYLCPVTLPKIEHDYVDYWKDVYGFNYDRIKEHAWQKAVTENMITLITPDNLLSEPIMIADYDLMTISCEDIAYMYRECIFAPKSNARLHGFALWFTCDFPILNASGAQTKTVHLDTSPFSPPTHWKQTVVLLPSVNGTLLDDPSLPIRCALCLNSSLENPRRYEISVELLTDSGDDEDSDMDCDIVMSGHESGCYCTKCIVLRACLQKLNGQ